MGRMLKLAMAGLAVVGAYKFAKGNRRTEDQARRGSGEDAITRRDPSRQGWDAVDEASYDSFPASDPPAHSRGKL